MAEDNVTLSGCVGKNTSWKVTIRVLNIWKQTDLQNKTTMNMIIVDKKGTTMHAKIDEHDIPTLEPKFKILKVYTISRFTCWFITRGYRFTEHKYQLWIQGYSKVEELAEDNDEIPKIGFKLISYNEVQSYKAPDKKFDCFDIMGRLEICSDPLPRKVRGKDTQIRHITLRNERNDELKVQLWGKLCDQIEEAINLKNQGTSAYVLLTSLMSNEWNGCSAQSSFGTMMYINIQSQQFNELKEAMVNIADVHFDNVKTLEQLKEIAKGSKPKILEYKCTVKITQVLSRNNWHNAVCRTCRVKTILEAGKVRKCLAHPDIENNGDEQYKILMDVEDETGTAVITGFGDSLRNLIGIDVNDMIQINIQENGVEQIGRLFDSFVGKTTTVLIELNNWNFENSDATSYTVKTTTEVPEIRSLANSLLKTHQLGPHTPMKKQRRRVINVDDEPDEVSNKKQKYIKKEPED